MNYKEKKINLLGDLWLKFNALFGPLHGSYRLKSFLTTMYAKCSLWCQLSVYNNWRFFFWWSDTKIYSNPSSEENITIIISSHFIKCTHRMAVCLSQNPYQATVLKDPERHLQLFPTPISHWAALNASTEFTCMWTQYHSNTPYYYEHHHVP